MLSLRITGWLLALAIGLMLGACGGGGDAPNQPPVAHGGVTQEVFVGATVMLDGTASRDPNGDALSYRWVMVRLPDGSAATLSNPTSATPSFVADAAGTYAATLVVNDGLVDSMPDSVSVTVAESPWSVEAAMPTPRTRLAVAAVGSLVYVIGGSSGGTPVATVEVFDTVTHTWAQAPAMPTARLDLAAAAAGGQVHAIGGYLSDVRAPFAIVEAFDPVAGLWATKAPMPTARYGGAAAAIGNDIYVAGGSGIPSCIDWPCHATNVLESYNVVTGRWTTHAPMPGSVIGAGAAALGADLYFVGGEIQGGIIIGVGSNYVERFDTVAGTWSNQAALPIVQGRNPSVVAAAGHLFLLGAPVLEYDPLANAWTAQEAPSTAGAGPNSVTVAGKVYVFDPAGTFVYDPAKDRP